MSDLGQLRELYEWMRSAGVLYARCGELELRLEPAPPPAVIPVAAPADHVDEEEEERRSLETLLYSSGAEVAPFLRAMRSRG